jgi:hypothetical protein
MHSLKKLESTIQTQIIRTAILYGALAGLVYWQFHFVYTGIVANLYHNTLIVIVFLFGATIATLKLFGFYNDSKALGALKETFETLRHEEVATEDQKLERYKRCLVPGTVFKRSKILGHVYELCMEELLRTRSMKVSVGTMQQVLHAVESSTMHERSILNYITGVLVLLGLIGTFIGLMEMVGSVGGIIGGVANSDSASPDAVKGLLHDLEAPLIGMATGFSASLFGLFGSLVIGLATRFMSDAAHAVREEFEEWLAGVAQIEKTLSGGTVGSGGGIGDSGLGAMATAIVSVFRSTQGALDRSSEVIRKLADKQDKQTEVLTKTLDHIEQLAMLQTQTSERLKGVEMIRSAVLELRTDMAELGRLQEMRFAESNSRLSNLVETQTNLLVDGVRDVVERQREIARATRSLEAQSTNGFARIGQMLETGQRLQAEGFKEVTEAQEDLAGVVRQTAQRIDGDQIGLTISSAIETRVTFAMNEMVRTLDGAFERLALTLDVVASTQNDLRNAVQGGGGYDRNGMRALGQSIETGMATGFAEVARSIDSVFAGYAEFVKRERYMPASEAAGHADPQVQVERNAPAVAPAEETRPTERPNEPGEPDPQFLSIEERLRPVIARKESA